MKREYHQHCSLARALDILGPRWTMLIIRELLPGPRRFKDLLDGLPGIGTGVLTERLRDLGAEGLITRRTLAPPSGATVYELTEAGRELEEPLFAIGRWGYGRLGNRPRRGDVARARWVMLTLRSVHLPEAAKGIDEVYEFRVSDETFQIKVKDGEVNVVDGPAENPDLVVRTDTRSLISGRSDPEQFLAGLEVEGSEEAQRHCLEIFSPALALS